MPLLSEGQPPPRDAALIAARSSWARHRRARRPPRTDRDRKSSSAADVAGTAGAKAAWNRDADAAADADFAPRRALPDTRARKARRTGAHRRGARRHGRGDRAARRGRRALSRVALRRRTRRGARASSAGRPVRIPTRRRSARSDRATTRYWEARALDAAGGTWTQLARSSRRCAPARSGLLRLVGGRAPRSVGAAVDFPRAEQ